MLVEDPIILIVDDSPNDALLMRAVFQRTGFLQPLKFVNDGEEAIAYLRGDGAYGNRAQYPLPNVLLLDLNMPRKNGFEVLAWIRQQPGLKRTCVYVLSASSRIEDIVRAYDLGANSYLVKPGNLDALLNLAKCLVGWLRVSHFGSTVHASKTHELRLVDGLDSKADPPGDIAKDESKREPWAGKNVAED